MQVARYQCILHTDLQSRVHIQLSWRSNIITYICETHSTIYAVRIRNEASARDFCWDFIEFSEICLDVPAGILLPRPSEKMLNDWSPWIPLSDHVNSRTLKGTQQKSLSNFLIHHPVCILFVPEAIWKFIQVCIIKVSYMRLLNSDCTNQVQVWKKTKLQGQKTGILITKPVLWTHYSPLFNSVLCQGVSRNPLLSKNAKSHWTGLAKWVLPSNHITQYSCTHLKDLMWNASD